MNIKKKAEEFVTMLKSGVETIRKACVMYVEVIDSNPEAKRTFIEQLPDIPPDAWPCFELVGRGAMDHRLLWGGGKAQSKLRRLPVSDQSYALEFGVPVADEKGDHRMVPVTALDSDDIKQVFTGSRIRTVPEQVVVLKKLRRMNNDEPEEADYFVRAGKLIVLKPMQIPISTLRRMVDRQ